MGKRVNFDYQKRQKELRKQKKRQEKLEAKRARKAALAAGEAVPDEGGVDMVEATDFDEPGDEAAGPSSPPDPA